MSNGLEPWVSGLLFLVPEGLDRWQLVQVWCEDRGQLRLCPHCGLLLLSVGSIPDACSCLYILVMADSISGSGRQFPARHSCGGPVGVPQWMFRDYWWPYTIPVKAVGFWLIHMECLPPMACGSPVELGLVFSLYTGPLPTHR